MKKLRLELDELAVESFATGEDEMATRGTVAGHISTRCTGGAMTCDDGNTCVPAGDTCANDTCYISCMGSCPCYPNYETIGCDGGGIYSQAYTGCGNCNPTANEVVSCQIAC
jgi:hypothetical protein